MVEKELEQWAVAYGKKLGLELLKLQGPVGWPDRTVIGPGLNGRVAFIEFKTTRGALAPAQIKWLQMLGAAGHPTAVVRTREQAQQFFEYLTGEAVGR